MKTSEVADLKQLIDYQSSAVVSSTLIDKQVGTVTLFAFDKDQGLSEHTAPYDALVQIVEGKALVTIAGEEFNLEAGEIIIMPANIPHAVKAIEKFKMLLVMIRSK